MSSAATDAPPVSGLPSQPINVKSRSASRYGSGLKSTPSTIAKTVAANAMVSAIVPIDVAA
jgi:hypothetical protein